MSRRHSLPAEVYGLVEQTQGSVLLECGKNDHTETKNENCTRLFTGPVRVCVANTTAEVNQLFPAIESAVASGLTAAGFFTYECGSCFEPKSRMRENKPGKPLAWFGIYERAYRFNHVSGVFIEGEPPGLDQFRMVKDKPDQALSIEAELGLTEEQYAQRIASIHQWIREGDVYQLNFTVPYTVKMRGSIAALYARLRQRQPVEYSALLHWDAGRSVLSFSPELFFRVAEQDGERQITTRPMKGTAARGKTLSEDLAHADWLRNDPKNRAENVMIVDLLRNDLGRIANFGSVHTEDLFAVERLPTLWQMTSTVKADLRPEVGYYDIFRALFPCGSVTGAPKVRAMQLLAELEGRPRGVYTGAIGYFSRECTVFNVAIRTLELDGNVGTMGVGSGIVIDSDAKEEYRECLLKAEFLTGATPSDLAGTQLPDQFSLIETMLWDGGYPLLQLHLDRLQASAEYFGFQCNRAAITAALEDRAQRFANSSARKVRLLLNSDGDLDIADELLPPQSHQPRIGRVRMATERTDSADRWLYHKTTQRPLYAQAFKAAVDAGFDDVLFTNERGELTEGAISNVFIKKDGKWLTPPVESGLLPGVYRRHLLETRANAEERVLYPEDLRRADAVYLCNALRGLREVEIDWNS